MFCLLNLQIKLSLQKSAVANAMFAEPELEDEVEPEPTEEKE